MSYRYPVAKPSLDGREMEYVMNAIRGGWVSSGGQYIKDFEQRFAYFNGMKHGIACSSGTTALILALRALGIGGGDEVIVPEFTMIASAWAVNYAGGKPVFVDCKDDLTIDTELIERKISSKTKAIMPVHIYGRSCNMDKIMDIAHHYNLRVVEDSAEAHGIKPVGDIACFSLYGNKIITAGEGGICVTNEERIAKQIAHLRSMAFTDDHDFIHRKFAYNFRMTNMQGAVALAQLERIHDFLDKRKKIEEYYDDRLRGIKGIKIMPKREVVWFYDLICEDRAELQNFLKDNGIETRQFFKPMSRQPMYYSPEWANLKAAKFGENGLYLPTYFTLNEGDIDYITEKIREFYEKRSTKTT